MVEDGNYGVTVAMKNNHVGENRLKDVAGKSRLVPEDMGCWRWPAAWGSAWAEERKNERHLPGRMPFVLTALFPNKIGRITSFCPGDVKTGLLAGGADAP